jgi:DNA-directed RNA polymerase subunit RPC12/RpoP
MTTTKSCACCGREFRRSPADATVRCPDCRRTTRKSYAAGYRPVACGRCGHVHTTLRCDRCGF